MDLSSGDYYRRLRVPRTATRRDIKAAFRRLARQYHPDLHPHKLHAASHFSAIAEAYEVLIDPVRRSHYDEQLARANRAADSFLGSKDAYMRDRQPKTAADFYLRGIRQVLAHRYPAALNDYSQAILLDPDFAEAYLRRAEVHYVLEDDSQVLDDCQQAIALNPTYAKTYYYQGRARYRLGYVQSAIAAFTDAIRCDAEDALYYQWRGIAYQDLREMDAAAKDFRRAVQLYREQGELANAKEMQQQLKTLGIAGQTRLQKLASQCFGHPKQRIYPVNSRTARPRKSRTSSQSKTYWAPGISSRPSQDAPLPSTSPKSGLFNVLRLLSNPSGELEPFYDALPVGKRAIVGYGLAVLANLCIVLGGTQYLANNSWQLASVFWISGGLTFVAMVFVLSMLRLCLRMRGSWAADIFILGATFIPLGSFAIAAALIPVGTQFLATPWDRMLTTGGLMLALLWTLSHMSIALRNGLCNIHKFSAATAAWLTPVILGLGLMTGLLTWLFI